MASSFIEIKDIGFWAKDSFVEVMQLCLINEIESQNLNVIKWIKEYEIELALQSLPLISGGMSMGLDEFLTTDKRKSEIIKLINSIIEKIDSRDNYITGSNLHVFRKRAMKILYETEKIEFKGNREFEKTVNDSRWNKSNGIGEIKNRYKHAFNLLKSLINGEMKTTASSLEDYWNF